MISTVDVCWVLFSAGGAMKKTFQGQHHVQATKENWTVPFLKVTDLFPVIGKRSTN